MFTPALAGLVALAVAGSSAVAASAAVTLAGRAAAPAAVTGAGHRLFAVSCPSKQDCVGVGVNSAADGGKGGPLAETWNGSRWRVDSVRLPTGAQWGNLGWVSCATAESCLAIGDNDSFAGVLTESWNGKTWTPGKLPSSAGLSISIDGVSCASAADCVAVGDRDSASGALEYPLAEVWNGRKWTAVKLPEPGKATYPYLDGVSCASAADCVAVGNISLADGFGTELAEYWNGKKWAASTPPVPAGGIPNTLEGVSCVRAKNCVAVGDYLAAGKSPGVADFWNGRKWTAGKVAGPDDSSLAGVSCATASSCAGFGVVSQNETFVAAWNGTTWKTATLSPPGGKGSGAWSTPYGVSCPSATSCVIVGVYGTSGKSPAYGFSQFWNGKSWRLTPVA